MANESNNGIRVTTQTYMHEVARGRVPGASLFAAFGELVTAGAVVGNIIWPNGTFYYPNQTTGDDITFVSTSAQDGVGGTGIQTIEIHYLDVNLEPGFKTITLDGLTPVTGQLSGVRFIQCMHIQTAGAGLKAAGVISAYKAGEPTIVYSLIAVGAVRCASSMRMVPRRKVAFIAGVVGSSISGTAAAGAQLKIAATELDNHQYLDPFILIPFGSVGSQDGSEVFTFPIPVPFNEGTVVGMTATTDKGSNISGDWFGWLEEAVV